MSYVCPKKTQAVTRSHGTDNIAQHMISLPSDAVVNMDENNFFDEVMDASLSSGKNKALQNIAVAKQSTVTIFDRKSLLGTNSRLVVEPVWRKVWDGCEEARQIWEG